MKSLTFILSLMYNLQKYVVSFDIKSRHEGIFRHRLCTRKYVDRGPPMFSLLCFV